MPAGKDKGDLHHLGGVDQQADRLVQVRHQPLAGFLLLARGDVGFDDAQPVGRRVDVIFRPAAEPGMKRFGLDRNLLAFRPMGGGLERTADRLGEQFPEGAADHVLRRHAAGLRRHAVDAREAPGMIDRHEGVGQAGKNRVERGTRGGRLHGLGQRQGRRPQQGCDEPALRRCRILGQKRRELLSRPAQPVLDRDNHERPGKRLHCKRPPSVSRTESAPDGYDSTSSGQQDSEPSIRNSEPSGSPAG